MDNSLALEYKFLQFGSGSIDDILYAEFSRDKRDPKSSYWKYSQGEEFVTQMRQKEPRQGNEQNCKTLVVMAKIHTLEILLENIVKIDDYLSLMILRK
jgi:hypothetical protein